MADETVGQRLIALRRRSGLTMDEVAEKLGLAGRSSVQRFFVAHMDKLEVGDALKLADVFDGLGDPPIQRTDVLGLAGFDRLVEVRPNPNPAPKYMDLPRDVPVYGTAMGTYRDDDEGPEIEQAFIDYADTIDHFARPPGYTTRAGIYGIYIAGTSMEPRWEQGDPAYADPKRPPQIGDDVIVYLVRPLDQSEEPEAVLIKRLIKQSASFIELEQFNPALTFRLERRRIRAIHRVIPRRELLAFH